MDFGFLKDIPNMLKDIPKVLLDVIKMLPLLMKALIFMVTTVPTYIINFYKAVYSFLMKAKPLVFAVIVTFFVIFFGIQYLFGYLTGMNGVIPAIPLALISIIVLYDIVINQNSQLKIFQSILLNGFIFIFNNPLLKDILGFNVKIDSKNPEKSFNDILKWTMKNIVKIIFTLFGLAIMLKLFIQKSWGYATFYTQG